MEKLTEIIPIFGFISRWSTKIWCSLIIPLGCLIHMFKPKHKIVKYGYMDPKICAEQIKEVKKIPS